MNAPHLQFRHLDADVLSATGALLEDATSAMPHERAQSEFQQWADTAADAYRLPRLVVSIDNDRIGRSTDASRSYVPSPGDSVRAAICLPGRSVIGLLTSFRRHMQHHLAPRAAGGPEADATAWALSVYHTVRPRQLALLSAEGCIRGLSSADHAEAATDGPDPAGFLLIDASMRRAIFAALRDFYGCNLDRDHRLAQLSRIVGRKVTTINGLTRAEGGRILSTLSERAAAPATRQLQLARAFIRQAAAEGRITAAARDRYLAMLNDEHGSAPTDAAALSAIRDRAIDLYRDNEICDLGLSDFLSAVGLAPYGR